MKIAKLLAVGTLALSFCAFAQKKITIEELINREAGVQQLKYENGVISSMIVVGKAAVPKAMRRNPGKAAEYAGKKAQADAQIQFTRFLSTKCKWGQTASGEQGIKEAAASSTDAAGNETSSESSEFTETEMTKEQRELAAQACVSALQVLGGGLDRSGRYTWVGGWNAKAAASIKGMAKTMNEAHAEVDNMGQAAKAKKAAEDKKELEAIEKAGTEEQDENDSKEGEEAADAKKTKKDVDILKGAQKPKSTVSSDAADFF